jgi:hypothetical protein
MGIQVPDMKVLPTHLRLALATNALSASLPIAQLLAIATALWIGIDKQSFYVGKVTLVIALKFFYVIAAVLVILILLAVAFAKRSKLAKQSLLIFLLCIAVFLAIYTGFNVHLVRIGIFSTPTYFKYIGL